jgi:hypothetical protein
VTAAAHFSSRLWATLRSTAYLRPRGRIDARAIRVQHPFFDVVAQHLITRDFTLALGDGSDFCPSTSTG